MTKNKLETFVNKKKFSAMKSSDYEFCISIFLKFWTPSGSNLDLDAKFLRDILDVKSMDKFPLEKEKKKEKIRTEDKIF